MDRQRNVNMDSIVPETDKLLTKLEGVSPSLEGDGTSLNAARQA
jgi:hypothetical protein